MVSKWVRVTSMQVYVASSEEWDRPTEEIEQDERGCTPVASTPLWINITARLLHLAHGTRRVSVGG
jgi:hypothetical protein